MCNININIKKNFDINIHLNINTNIQTKIHSNINVNVNVNIDLNVNTKLKRNRDSNIEINSSININRKINTNIHLNLNINRFSQRKANHLPVDFPATLKLPRSAPGLAIGCSQLAATPERVGRKQRIPMATRGKDHDELLGASSRSATSAPRLNLRCQSSSSTVSKFINLDRYNLDMSY